MDRAPEPARDGGRQPLLPVIAQVSAVALAAAAGALWGWRVFWPPVETKLPPALIDSMVYCPRGMIRTGQAGPLRAIGDFWVDRFEVTQAEFRSFVNASGHHAAGRWDAPCADPTMGPEETPVASVSLADARAFAAAAGKRLPTAAEWEWAARGPEACRFPWKNDGFAPNYANTLELGLQRPTRIGTFYNGQSRFSGAYDLVGNVAEWTSTSVRRGFETRFVVFGGSFLHPASDAILGSGFADIAVDEAPGRGSGARLEFPESWSSDLGFRCVVGRDEAQRDLEVRAALVRLGARDPIGWWSDVRPALATLRRGDPTARRLVRAAAALEQSAVVRERLAEVLARMSTP